MYKYELINNYLEQLSNQTACTIGELNLLQKHIKVIKNCLDEQGELAKLPEQPIVNQEISQQATDLIRIKEVMRMVGVSRSSIYSFMNNGTFPKPINLGARSVAWQRGVIERWVLDKVNAQ